MTRSPCEERVQALPGFTPTAAYDESLCLLAERFQALADTTRLRILDLLITRGETCVCELMPLLGLTQSNISFHLKTLKHAGFISARKDGKWTYYSLTHRAIEQFQTDLAGVFRHGTWSRETEQVSGKNVACGQIECQEWREQQ